MITVLAVGYAALVVAHLAGCAIGSRRLRWITKPLLMPVLLALFLVNGHGVTPLLVAALVLAAAGDVLLLRASLKWVVLGGIAFLACHLLYGVTFAMDVDPAKVPPFVWLAAVVYVGAALLVHRAVRANLGRLQPPVIAYLVVLAAMSFGALLRFASLGSAAAGVTFLGSVIFLVSDYCLLLDSYRRPLKHGHFVIMSTYLAAQTLIVAGFMVA